MTGERRQQFLQQFGRRVRAARILKGLSLQHCATLAGISYSNLSVIERGKRSMYVEHLPALAQALGVPAHYLLGEDAPAAQVPTDAMLGVDAEAPARTSRVQAQDATAVPPAKRPRTRKAAPVA
jgi:transcriptional regulator with XRE-family HTH domain